MSGTIEMMGEEIKYQVDDLPTFSEYLGRLGPPPKSEIGGEDCVFVGAGDSFAAAKAAEHLSGFRMVALDPYDICLRPEIIEDKHLFLVSVSGRTRTNIEAAQAADGTAKRITAITADVHSVLAENCDDSIRLIFRRTGQLTSGTGSFTATLLACCSRIREPTKIPDLGHMLEKCLDWSDRTRLPRDGTTFMVGTGLGYSMAIYGVAKIYEVLGWKSQYQTTEQFSHMELFSLSEDDLVLLIPDSKNDKKSAQLENLLVSNECNVAKIDLDEMNDVIRSILIALHLQVLPWRTAIGEGLKECYFKMRSKHLRISDAIIY